MRLKEKIKHAIVEHPFLSWGFGTFFFAPLLKIFWELLKDYIAGVINDWLAAVMIPYIFTFPTNFPLLWEYAPPIILAILGGWILIQLGKPSKGDINKLSEYRVTGIQKLANPTIDDDFDIEQWITEVIKWRQDIKSFITDKFGQHFADEIETLGTMKLIPVPQWASKYPREWQAIIERCERLKLLIDKLR